MSLPNILKEFNNESSILVIGGFPEKGELYSHTTCTAIGGVTKQTLLGLQKDYPDKKIVVVTFATDTPHMYKENGMLIIRCIKRNNIASFKKIITYCLLLPNIRNVIIPFEFTSFGEILATIAFLLPLFFMRALNKDIILILHQVVFNAKDIAGHIGKKKKNPWLMWISFGIITYTKLLTIPAKKIVVYEKILKQRLQQIVPAKKIVVIPHPVSSLQIKEEKQKKSTYTLLFFGFLTWYKGIDFLARAIKEIKTIKGKRVKLIIAGGASVTNANKVYYKKFLRKLQILIHNEKRIHITDFVPEEQITKYFQQADLVVFPYRTCMSSPGPLSFAFSFHKPILLSNKLKPLLRTERLEQTMKNLKIRYADIFFSLYTSSLRKTLRRASEKGVKEKLILLSEYVSQKRAVNTISAQFALLFENPLPVKQNTLFPISLSKVLLSFISLPKAVKNLLW